MLTARNIFHKKLYMSRSYTVRDSIDLEYAIEIGIWRLNPLLTKWDLERSFKFQIYS
ncbi:hypothetical protein MTHERMMSTA1_09020 [Methanosarcina thermophila MST-A1]|uniref:Uncharacterized protein n=1 Tax=Methanosarcina thermophila TaxID=2210 RepID=A0A3G9CUM3_METTE|nr:hypothetical protein MESMT1_2072 [Methanosarcina thermophila]GLI13776.1 hypothetical protein MTHERMMSTA1_09020 [Methanosarcina thermophila MST-A1]